MSESADRPAEPLPERKPEVSNEVRALLPPSGTPTRLWTEEQRRIAVEAGCAIIAEGFLVGEAAAAIGVQRNAIRNWAQDDKALLAMYDRARIDQAHAMAEDIVSLSDKAVPGKNGDVEKVRLQCDSRKFLTAKIAPRIYGDKLEVAGPGGIPLIPLAPTRVDLSKLSIEQLETMHALTALATVVVEVIDQAPPQAALPAGESRTGE